MRPENPTRVVRAKPVDLRPGAKAEPRHTTFAQRVALFVVGLKKSDAAALLEGFAEPQRHQARRLVTHLAGLDSPTRQARLALEFGPGDASRDRVRDLLAEAPPALSAALARAVPAALRPPSAPTTTGAEAPLLSALASRLVREAMRSSRAADDQIP